MLFDTVSIVCLSWIYKRLHFTFCLQTVQFIQQGFAHFKQLSPHRPHTDFGVNTNFHPLPAGWRCRKSRRSLPEGNTEDYYSRVRVQLIGQSSFVTRIPNQQWNNCLMYNYSFLQFSLVQKCNCMQFNPPGVTPVWAQPVRDADDPHCPSAPPAQCSSSAVRQFPAAAHRWAPLTSSLLPSASPWSPHWLQLVCPRCSESRKKRDGRSLSPLFLHSSG